MPANDATLLVRMPQTTKRYIKSMAARQGLTLRQAGCEPFDKLRGRPWARSLPRRAAAPQLYLLIATYGLLYASFM